MGLKKKLVFLKTTTKNYLNKHFKFLIKEIKLLNFSRFFKSSKILA